MMNKELELIWNILWDYRECSIPEGDDVYDELWGEITYAMSRIQEELGAEGIIG